MTLETIITAAAVLVAVASLPFTIRAANAARHQTAIQRQVREDAAQPYVWVDLRPSDQHGQLILLVVGNSGPTVATDVRVKIDGDLERGKADRGTAVRDALSKGITALAPGRTMAWSLGVPWDVIQKNGDNSFQVTVDAHGPFGALPTLAYTIDLETLRHSSAVPPGTLHGVAEAIKALGKSVVGEMKAEARVAARPSAPEGGAFPES